MEKTDGPRRNQRQKDERRQSSRAAARTYTCDVDPAVLHRTQHQRGFYYKLKKQKLNPREIKIGTRTLITFEAAADWRAERQAASVVGRKASAGTRQNGYTTANRIAEAAPPRGR